MSHASYLLNVFNKKYQDRTVRNLRKVLADNNVKFDGFIVTGVSGITMGAIMSRSLKKDLVIVRKDEEYATSHSYYKVENYCSGKRYIFLDDLIASGRTLKRVKRSIADFHETENSLKTCKPSKIIGVLLYYIVSLEIYK
jgi:adenine/guanine phosphoribosyltransferase-like PRPP-binding protein